MRSLLVNFLATLFLSSIVFADCSNYLLKYERFTHSPLVSYEKLNDLTIIKVKDFLENRAYSKEQLIQKGKDVFNASKKMRAESVVRSQDPKFATYMEIPSDQEFIDIAQTAMTKEYLELLDQKKNLLIKASKQLEQNGIKNAMSKKVQLETLQFWKSSVESQLDSLLSYMPQDLKAQLEGIEIAYKSFQNNIQNKITSIDIASTKISDNLIAEQLSIQIAKTTPKKESSSLRKIINKVKNRKKDESTKKLLESQEDISDIYTELSTKWDKLIEQSRQDQNKALDPVLDLLDNFDRHFASLPSQESLSPDPIFKIYQKITRELKDHFKVEKIEIIKGKTKFDADFHFAVSKIPVEGSPSGIIQEVIQTGYAKPNTVLRYPKVIVSE